jgi:AraC-like DNA-binding protein
MSESRERTNRMMLRVRDALDRDYATEVDLEELAGLVHLSPDHLIRTFRSVFGETPHRYLQRRRIERAMFLLRTTGLDVTDVCVAVGYTSLGTFSRLFAAVVGQPPSQYARHGPLPPVPGCFMMTWTRPSSFTHPPAPARNPSIPEKHPSELRG